MLSPQFCTITGTVIKKIQYRLCYLDTSKHYRYGKFTNYNNVNAIVTLITITGTVIGKITIPVMQW
jgi:hypothetical protein